MEKWFLVLLIVGITATVICTWVLVDFLIYKRRRRAARAAKDQSFYRPKKSRRLVLPWEKKKKKNKEEENLQRSESKQELVHSRTASISVFMGKVFRKTSTGGEESPKPIAKGSISSISRRVESGQSTSSTTTTETMLSKVSSTKSLLPPQDSDQTKLPKKEKMIRWKTEPSMASKREKFDFKEIEQGNGETGQNRASDRLLSSTSEPDSPNSSSKSILSVAEKQYGPTRLPPLKRKSKTRHSQGSLSSNEETVGDSCGSDNVGVASKNAEKRPLKKRLSRNKVSSMMTTSGSSLSRHSSDSISSDVNDANVRTDLV